MTGISSADQPFACFNVNVTAAVCDSPGGSSVDVWTGMFVNFHIYMYSSTHKEHRHCWLSSRKRVETQSDAAFTHTFYHLFVNKRFVYIESNVTGDLDCRTQIFVSMAKALAGLTALAKYMKVKINAGNDTEKIATVWMCTHNE